MIYTTNWRKSGERLAEAARILNDPATRSMLAILELDHPAHQKSKAVDGFGTTKEIGFIEGYETALALFRSMAVPLPVAPQELKSTFGVSEEAK